MVMANNDLDAPSAQHVGREFVRQYYTLLNEAPYHLHRFYSHNSCFVHGGVEKPGEEQPPVMGQTEIHNKILSLNFRDCHAKIRQVDSQATVGHGVVIQVTGELSNNGEPMRRFMQTFVLAPQSPKKYYVHNDVFRYQDEVFIDEEEEPEDEQSMPEVEVNGGETAEPPPSDATYFESPPAISNGSVHEDEEGEEVVALPDAEKAAEPNDLEAASDLEALDIQEDVSLSEQSKEEPEPEPEQPVEQKPFSWAALASKNTSGQAGLGAPNTPAFPPVTPVKTPQSRIESKPEATVSSSSGMGSGAQMAPPQPQRTPRPPKESRYTERDRSSMSRGEEGDGDSVTGRRGGAKYPDSNQLFVGNLPHNITERELKVFFEQYGKVLELRINTKSGGGKLPNFGFVVFSGPDPVQDILKLKPIKYNGEHRLNVEEKKPRGSEGRPSSGRGAARGGGIGRGGGGSGGGQYGSGRGVVKGGFGRPNDGERRGMGGSAGGISSRGGLNQAPSRR